MKYTFIMEETDIRGELVGNKLVSEFAADSLEDILVRFQDFLKGSGFVFDGQLDVINDEWDEDFDGVEEFETPQEPVHDWTQTLRDDVEWPFAKQTAEYTTPKFNPAQELYDEMDYGVANRPKNTAPWDWTVKELMKGPITTKDVEVNFAPTGAGYTVNYGAGQPSIFVPTGIDTITLTGLQPGGSVGISCELCGLPRNVMKSHNCYDDNCPKGTWK
jgi:hypothetical protein